MDDPDDELEELDTGNKTPTRTARPAARALRGFIDRAAGGGPLPRDPRGRLLSEKQIVEGLDRVERWLGALMAVLVLAVMIFWAVGLFHQHPKKGQQPLAISTGLIYLGVPVVTALLAGLAVVIKRRALLGFTTLLLGLILLSYGTGVFGIAYIGFAAWLLYRAYKLGKQRREAGGAASSRRGTRAGPASRSAGSRSRTSASATTARGGSRHRQPDPAAKRPPQASKRYTPPRPPRRPSSSNGAR